MFGFKNECQLLMIPFPRKRLSGAHSGSHEDRRALGSSPTNCSGHPNVQQTHLHSCLWVTNIEACNLKCRHFGGSQVEKVFSDVSKNPKGMHVNNTCKQTYLLVFFSSESRQKLLSK